MQTLQPNIIIKKGAPWLQQDYLLQQLPDLNDTYLRVKARPVYKESVSKCFQDNDILPDTGKAWRWAKLNGTFYYAYDNIPDKAPACYKSNLPSRAELLNLTKKTATPAVFLPGDFKAFISDNYTQYLHCYGDCSKQQQQKLATACAVLDYSSQYITATGYDVKKNTLFIDISNTIQEEDLSYIPKNFRRLKEKILKALDGEQVNKLITLPRADNKNASTYNEEEVESWVYHLRDMGQNYTNSFIIRKVWEMCRLNEKPEPSERWIGTIMEKYKMKYLTAGNRFGDKNSLTNSYKGYVPMANALFAGDCWQVDATRFNIIGHKADDKSIKYLFIVVIRDVHSGDIVGYDFDYAENRWVYTNALAMAVKTTGYLPWELVLDRFPGHNSEEFTNLIADLRNRKVKVTITSKTTGKQRLERHFGTLQTVFMQDSAFYYGQGIKSRRRYAHRSEAYLAAQRKRATAEGFNYDAAVDEASKIVEKYRHTPLNEYSHKYKSIAKSPAQLHQDCEKPNVRYVEPSTYAYLFGLKKVLKHNSGLFTTEIFKTQFLYRTTDFKVISNYAEMLVVYDLEDLSFCHLYENSLDPLKKYLGTAQEEIPALGFGPDAQWASVTRQQAIIKHINEERQQELLHRKAVGDDIVTLLTPGYSNKDDYSNAESTYINAQVSAPAMWKAQDDDGYEADVRDEY